MIFPLRIGFLLLVAFCLLIVAAMLMSGCSRRDAQRNQEVWNKTFVVGTTEAIRNFRPQPKRPALPVTTHLRKDAK